MLEVRRGPEEGGEQTGSAFAVMSVPVVLLGIPQDFPTKK